MKIYLFSSTHWDREWYMPFQAFRMRLVGMMNRMLEILETDEEFGVFHFDGQTVVLEDYLEIYPENRERLEKLIKSGKLVVGPWYVMPDELLLSGESYIKNLQKGFEISRKFGTEPMKFGYLCDMFGHCAQMPQILKGMGINNALVGRGANDHTTPMHFVWDAPSGDGVATFKLQDSAGYSAFQIKVLRPLLGTDYTEEQERENLKNYIDFEIDRANQPVILLMDGDDHQECRKDTVRYIKMIREMYPEAEVSNDNIEFFFKDISAFESVLPHRTGELIEPTKQVTDYSNLLTNCLSSRYPIKKKNDYIQSRMEKVIEPLFTLGKLCEPYRYIELANTYLLKNHAHDTICGCSVDVIHRDMMTRFEQTEAICDHLMNEYWDSRRNDENGENIAIEILNPLPYSDIRTVEAEIWFPQNWKTKYGEYFGYERLNSFKLYDEQGNEIPYGITNVFTNSCKRYYNMKFGFYDVYTVSFEATLGAMRTNRFIVKPSTERQRYLDFICANEDSAENAYIAIKFDSFGHMSMVDKISGRHYDGLLATVDDCEIGDGWNHGSCANNFTVSNTLHSIVLKERSYSRATFEITQKLTVPDRILETNHGINRDTHTKDLFVIHTVSLGRNEKFVDIKTKVINNVTDHRLRLKLPTGINTDTYFVNQPFCFVERKTGIDLETQNWKEKSIQEKQTAGIVYVKDDKGGLSFISDYGIHECAVTNEAEIYITLMRCFSKTHLTDGQPDGQIQGEHEYRYILMPTNVDTVFAELQRRQDFLQTDGMVSNVMPVKVQEEASAIEIKGKDIVYSTLTVRDGRKELRIYNDSDNTSVADIKFSENISEASLIDLDGKEIKELNFTENHISVELKKWKIATICYK